MTIRLLPSPLLPAGAYAGLAASLTSRGHAVVVADGRLAPGEGAHELVARWARNLDPTDALVAHSNAGYLAPCVRAARTGRSAAEVLSPGPDSVPTVFMDAALLPGEGTTRLAPEGFRAHLDTLADADGILPPWTRWWPRATMAQVLPGRVFEDLDSRCPHLPLAYFDTELHAPGGWTDAPNAHLAFGDTYAEELAFAERAGWPVHRMQGAHLHFLHDPDGVASAIDQLLDRLRAA